MTQSEVALWLPGDDLSYYSIHSLSVFWTDRRVHSVQCWRGQYARQAHKEQSERRLLPWVILS